MIPAALASICCGCARPTTGHPRLDVDARASLPVYAGDGALVGWPDLLDAVRGADVILVGEQHDDAVGHRVQLAMVEDVLALWPGSAVSMEMFDRREQAVVDDYLAGFIDRETFYERTASTRWRKITTEYLDGTINRRTFEKRITRLGWPDWEGNYQPIIDAAREAGAPVIAANTPWLVYMSVARKEGFEALDEVTPAQRALFDVPVELPTGSYRERFWETIAGRAEGEEPEDETDEDDENHGGLSDEQVLGMFRAQSVMDATMARSIVDALADGAPKVVHLVGQFHSDFEGGLVLQLRQRLPSARILVVSMQSAAGDTMRDDDADRADFVIYTGER